MKIKCLIGLHDWKRCGMATILLYQPDGRYPVDAYDRHLFQCRRCPHMKEIKLAAKYVYFDVDEQEELEVED